MSDAMSCTAANCPGGPGGYCANCVLGLVGLAGLHVVAVDVGGTRLIVAVESAPGWAGCPDSHGRRVDTLIDAPAFGAPGAGAPAQAHLVLPGVGLPGGGLHQAG